MVRNLDRYRQDLDSLLQTGEQLHVALQRQCFPEKVEQAVRERHGKKAAAFLSQLPLFDEEYQAWYSEAKVLIRQLLPDRLADFTRHYEKPKPRTDITFENYRIEDALQGLTVTREWEREVVVGPDAAIPHVRQQLAILRSVRARFESSLFDIRQLVQADVFDSELEAATELAKQGFHRAAGALAGVVLERHLEEVCKNHAVKIGKRNPTIANLNDSLKGQGVVDVPEWRFVQHLTDIRNLCDHNKKAEPTVDQIQDLIAGVTKVTKTVL